MYTYEDSQAQIALKNGLNKWLDFRIDITPLLQYGNGIHFGK